MHFKIVQLAHSFGLVSIFVYEIINRNSTNLSIFTERAWEFENLNGHFRHLKAIGIAQSALAYLSKIIMQKKTKKYLYLVFEIYRN